MDLVEGIDVAKSRKLSKLVIAKNCHLSDCEIWDCEICHLSFRKSLGLRNKGFSKLCDFETYDFETEDIFENSDFQKMRFRK